MAHTDSREAIDPRRILKGKTIEPADSARAARCGAVLTAPLADALAAHIEKLRGNCSCPDTAGVGFHDPDDLGDGGGRDARADTRAAREGVRAGDIGVGAAVNV